MDGELKKAIEENYDLRVAKTITAACGAVAAQTWVLRDTRGRDYFCKIVDRPDFIPIILPTLPVLREMKDRGITRIAAPLPTRDGLSARHGGALILLLDYFDAPQSYDYDLATFGELIGNIHALTPQLEARLRVRGFTTFREKFFREDLPALMARQTDDPVLQALQALLEKHKAETNAILGAFFRLSARGAASPCAFVNTHGDVMGNVLVRTPKDICLIDWDEMEFAPPERDLWRVADKPEFMAGYRRVRPGFNPDPDALKHATLKNYLEGIPIYLEAILDEKRGADARMEQVRKLEAKRLQGWMKPLVLDILRAEGG